MYRKGIYVDDQRWTVGEGDDVKEERAEIVAVVNTPEFADLVPSQIVPKLANRGEYIASESTIYRVLKEEKMNAHRNRSKQPVKRTIPTHIATAPNQVWTWDITWLPGPIRGLFFYRPQFPTEGFSKLSESRD